jgi:hypothetical protein
MFLVMNLFGVLKMHGSKSCMKISSTYLPTYLSGVHGPQVFVDLLPSAQVKRGGMREGRPDRGIIGYDVKGQHTG